MSTIRFSTLVLFATTACASNPSPSSAGAAVRVDNQAAYNMDVYVIQHDSPVRLGFAPSKEVTRLPIPPALIAGAGIIRFEARPTRAGERVVSDPFTVHPGDDLSWVIPPQ